jgi:hypothetical protein
MVPVCPSLNCARGNIVVEVQDPSAVEMPDGAWQKLRSHKLWRCTYCGLIWYLLRIDAPKPFTRPVAVGLYNSVGAPGFLALAAEHPLLRAAEPLRKKRKPRRSGKERYK